MRLTEAQARRMGLKLPTESPGGSKTAVSRKTARKPKGRDRAARSLNPGLAVSFVLPLPFDPKPKERPRTVASKDALRAAFLSARGNLEAFMAAVSSGISRTYTPQATADYEKIVATAASVAMAGSEPFTCAVETEITLVLSGDVDTWPTSRLDGDADNLEKAVLDAMNGIVFADDRLVVRSFREKRCGPQPEIRVSVAPAKP